MSRQRSSDYRALAPVLRRLRPQGYGPNMRKDAGAALLVGFGLSLLGCGVTALAGYGLSRLGDRRERREEAEDGE